MYSRPDHRGCYAPAGGRPARHCTDHGAGRLRHDRYADLATARRAVSGPSPYHAHNRLIGSVTSTGEERRELARFIAGKLNQAQGPTAFLLPRRGLHAWDRPGQGLHEPEAHQAYVDEFRRALRLPVVLHDLDLHINDPEFVAKSLEIFDQWVAAGVIARPGRGL